MATAVFLFAGGRPSSLLGEENLELPDKHQRELDYENCSSFNALSINVVSLYRPAVNTKPPDCMLRQSLLEEGLSVSS